MSAIDPARLEAATRRIGEEIFQRAEHAAPSFFSQEYWQTRGMEWLTRDEDLKLRLFRFIEVLPTLRNSVAVARHLKEYLDRNGEHGQALPLALEAALSFGRCDSFHASLAAWGARTACVRSATQFICGSTPQEAIASVLRMRREGMAFTLDVLGETVIADRIAAGLQQLYIELVEQLSASAPDWPASPVLDVAPWGSIPRVNISIKLTGIVAKFDPIDPTGTADAVLARLRPVLRAAQRCGAFINIDMEHFAVKDLTLDIYKRVMSEPEFNHWPDCGIVIQAYLSEGERDMADLIAWARQRGTPVTVRLVKGAYWDYETATAIRSGWPIPVFTKKWQSDTSFERIARMMLEGADIIRPAFASHNVRSIAHALALEESLGLSPRTVELQMLTGMGEPLKRAVVEMGQRLRVYAPFGNLIPGMAYLIRRLIENTANESFLRQSFGGQASIDEFLRAPGPHWDPTVSPLPKPIIEDTDEYAEMNPFENESEVDFSRPANRRTMDEALAKARAQFGRRYPAIIDGESVEAGRWRDALNPSDTSQIVGQTAICDAAMADRAVEASQRAAEEWAATPPVERAALMSKAANRLHDRRFEFAAWLVYEVGKPWREAHGDVMEAIDYLRFYAFEMERLTSRVRRRSFTGESNEYLYGPRGVVAVLSPFSFPIALLAGMTSAALVTGNTVIVKPASQASTCGYKLVELLNGVGLPVGVLNFVPGKGEEIGAHLVRHPGVDMIAFTGSSAIGCRIIEEARHVRAGQPQFKHVIADMGGKNALIVDDDADLDEAVQAMIASGLGYSGQKCTSCSRAIVLSEVHDDFVSKLVEAVRGVKPAAADLPGTTVGPLVDAEALARAKQYVEIGKREARCVLDCAETEMGATGYYFAPVIFADARADSRIAQEEILAPILTVLRADTFEQALEIADATPYALTAGVFSRSPAHIELAKRRLHVGTIYVNRKTTVSRVDRQPFGGFRMSGLGTKTGGPDYLLQFMLPRTVCENTMRHGFAPMNEHGTIRNTFESEQATPS